MKQLRDISHDELSEDIDVRDPHRQTEPEVSQTSEHIHDISCGERDDEVDVRGEYTIQLEKKRGKRFDALEVPTGFFQKRLKKDLNMQEREPFSLMPYWLPIKRYIRSLGVLGTMIWVMIFLVILIFFGWADKLFIENRVNA